MRILDELPCNIVAFPLRRMNFIKKWEDLEFTITEHITKVLLIVNDNACRVWLKELDSKVELLCKLKTKGRISNETYQEEIYERLCFENQLGIPGVIKRPIRAYIQSPRNKSKTALVREYEIVEFESDMNAFLYEFIEIAKFYKEIKGGDYIKGSLQKSKVIKEIVAKYRNRAYQRINIDMLDAY